MFGAFMAERAKVYLDSLSTNESTNDTPLVEDTTNGNYGSV